MHPKTSPLQQLIFRSRPKRPPNGVLLASPSRFFTCRSPLRIIARASPKRPFIPFLSRSLRPKDPLHISRFISSDTKAYLKRQWKIFLWLQLCVWIVCSGGAIGYTLLQDDWMDKVYPAPEEWGYFARRAWYRAHREIDTEGEGVVADPGKVASQWCRLVLQLEGSMVNIWLAYIKEVFGQDLPKDPAIRTSYDWDKDVPGFDDVNQMLRVPGSRNYDSKIGYDVLQKSEEWRRGYFEALMGYAKGCEDMFGTLATKAPIAWPREFVFSDDNPYPKELPQQVPLERPHIDDCWDAFDDPDLIYSRILTTKGFSRVERMQAGIAYAQWLSFRGKNDYAVSMFNWALKLACEGTNQSDRIIDQKSGVIKANAPFVTHNILSVATALASHYASADEPTKALNIYLSVLRARQGAPEAPAIKQYKMKRPDYSLGTPDSVLRFLLSLPFREPFPAPATTGDEKYERTKTDECDEAALKTWVGEILFAKTAQRKQGLEWTSEAVDIVETRRKDPKLDPETKKLCAQCLETSYENWLDMVQRLTQEQKGERPVTEEVKPGFLGRLWKQLPYSDPLMDGTDWAKEYHALDRRYAKYKGNKIDAQMANAQRKLSKTFIV